MAFNVSVIYKAIDQFTQPVKKMAAASKEMQAAISPLSKPVSMGGLISGIGMLAGGFAALEGLKSSVAYVTEFEDKLLELSALTGATGTDLESLKYSAMKLGKQFGQSGTDVMEGMKLIGGAKPELLSNIPALQSVTKEVMTLSKASGVDMATASRVVAESLNQMGAGADQAARFVNVLAAEAKLGSSEVDETGRAVIKSAVAAKMSGASFEQLNSMIESLAHGGIKAEMAGTGLAAVLMKLSAKGYTVGKQGLDGMFGKLKTSLEKVKDPAKRTAELMKLVGLENVDVATILMNSAGSMDAYTKSLTGTSIASEQAAIRMQSVSAKWAQLKATVQEKLVMVFDEGSMSLMGDFLDRMKQQIDTLDPAGLQVIGAAFGLVGMAISGIVQLIGLLVGAFVELIGLLGKAAKLLALVFAYIGSGGSVDFGAEMKAILPESQSFADLVGMGKDKPVTGEIQINVNDPKGVLKSVSAAGNGVDMPTGKNMAGAG